MVTTENRITSLGTGRGHSDYAEKIGIMGLGLVLSLYDIFEFLLNLPLVALDRFGDCMHALAAATAEQTDHTDDYQESDQDDDNDDKIGRPFRSGVDSLTPLYHHLLDFGDAASLGTLNLVRFFLLFDGSLGFLGLLSSVFGDIIWLHLLLLRLQLVFSHLLFHKLIKLIVFL